MIEKAIWWRSSLRSSQCTIFLNCLHTVSDKTYIEKSLLSNEVNRMPKLGRCKKYANTCRNLEYFFTELDKKCWKSGYLIWPKSRRVMSNFWLICVKISDLCISKFWSKKAKRFAKHTAVRCWHCSTACARQKRLKKKRKKLQRPLVNCAGP